MAQLEVMGQPQRLPASTAVQAHPRCPWAPARTRSPAPACRAAQQRQRPQQHAPHSRRQAAACAHPIQRLGSSREARAAPPALLAARWVLHATATAPVAQPFGGAPPLENPPAQLAPRDLAVHQVEEHVVGGQAVEKGVDAARAQQPAGGEGQRALGRVRAPHAWQRTGPRAAGKASRPAHMQRPGGAPRASSSGVQAAGCSTVGGNTARNLRHIPLRRAASKAQGGAARPALLGQVQVEVVHVLVVLAIGVEEDAVKGAQLQAPGRQGRRERGCGRRAGQGLARAGSVRSSAAPQQSAAASAWRFARAPTCPPAPPTGTKWRR